MVDITKFIPVFNRIKRVLDEYNLIIIYGAEGTGKTMFIRNYIEKLSSKNIQYVDSSTNINFILKFFRTVNFLHDYKILVYDDIKIRKELLKEIAKILIKQKITNKFIVIVNKINKPPKEYQVIETRYPSKNEIFRYINELTYRGVRETPRKEPIDDDLRKLLMNLKPANMRRINMSIEDGFYSGVQEETEKFHITKMGNYMLSLGIAENLSWLRRFDEILIQADKFKNNKSNFYLDFIKLYYPTIEKMRLRYPTKLYEIIKKRNN